MRLKVIFGHPKWPPELTRNEIQSDFLVTKMTTGGHLFKQKIVHWSEMARNIVRGPDMEKVNPSGDFVRPIFLNTWGCLKHESKCWMAITSHRK